MCATVIPGSFPITTSKNSDMMFGLSNNCVYEIIKNVGPIV